MAYELIVLTKFFLPENRINILIFDFAYVAALRIVKKSELQTVTKAPIYEKLC